MYMTWQQPEMFTRFYATYEQSLPSCSFVGEKVIFVLKIKRLILAVVDFWVCICRLSY